MGTYASKIGRSRMVGLGQESEDVWSRWEVWLAAVQVVRRWLAEL